VQSLTHSDARLKGLAALTIMSSTRPNNAAGTAPAAEAMVGASGAAARQGYVATYRLITGRGFGHYHVWEVTLDARAGNQLGSPLSGNSSSGGSGLVYKQSWRHLYQGSINGPTMNFAHFVESRIPASEGLAQDTGTAARLSLWEQCQQRARLDQGKASTVHGSCEVIASETQKDLRAVSLSDLNSIGGSGSSGGTLTASKPTTLKDTTGTRACSQDGRILFGGKYEFVVSILESSRRSGSPGPGAWPAANGGANSGNNSDVDEAGGTARVTYHAVFSLSDFAPGAVGKSSKKTSRHLREVSGVWCTPDGAYALVLCTDNAVLLYRYDIRQLYVRVILRDYVLPLLQCV
jgi:hypothetical protein